MNLQQLEYILAVDTYRHFATAADNCHVTQATLSMMVKKLEQELGVRIFDRSRQPVIPTDKGIDIIRQARVILHETGKLTMLAKTGKEVICGELKLGIIPTLSPYLLPLFLDSFLKKYPEVKLNISELTTSDMLRNIESQQLDAGILALPVSVQSYKTTPLFYEEFVAFASPKSALLKKKYLLPADMDINKLWLLEEGHCLRNQVINFCELKVGERTMRQLDFSAASLETIRKIVEQYDGITILPKLATSDLTKKQLNQIRAFKKPVPAREIGLISYRQYSKESILTALANEIRKSVPAEMRTSEKKEVVNPD